jgi:hypothetical protein
MSCEAPPITVAEMARHVRTLLVVALRGLDISLDGASSSEFLLAAPHTGQTFTVRVHETDSPLREDER